MARLFLLLVFLQVALAYNPLGFDEEVDRFPDIQEIEKYFEAFKNCAGYLCGSSQRCQFCVDYIGTLDDYASNTASERAAICAFKDEVVIDQIGKVCHSLAQTDIFH